MTVFISHAFANHPEFQNVADWLDRDHVPYWQPAEIRAGESLREQLRVAVKACSVCVFVATHRSVASSWCGAELGAFWGARTPIIVYLADSSLPEEALPPIVQGDVWERQLSRVAARAGELVSRAQSGADLTPEPTASVATLTVEQLEKLVTGALSLVEARVGSSEPGFSAAAAAAAGRVIRGVNATRRLPDDDWQRRILWVDDRPANNWRERKALESFGVDFTLAESTGEALNVLARQRFAVIISDMGRPQGAQEGYKLLEAVRARDISTPFFIYSGSGRPEHRQMALARGAQGATNMADDLIDMVLAVLEGRSM